MATIYPNPISPTTQSRAEKRVYRFLRDNLSDSYTVIHGWKWVTTSKNSKSYEGEGDFLILHPTHGALCVEVKGGGIRVDSTSRQEQWFSEDRSGKEHSLDRSPIQQAKDSQYALRDKLKNDKRTASYWQGASRSVRWAVCFPDVLLPKNRTLTSDAPHELVIDSEKLNDIQEAIENIFQFWNGSTGLKMSDRPTTLGIDAVVEMLAPTWELMALKSIAYSNALQELEKLTEDQFIVLHELSGAKRALITGGAGTGKTLLAMEQARRLTSAGLNTLYLCFNRNLVNRINQHIGDSDSLSIMTFNQVVKLFARRASIEWNEPQDTDELFRDYLPNTLAQATKLVPDRYDAIIVDEGQDFDEMWWVVIEDLLADDNSRLFVFYDANQTIYTPAKEMRSIINVDKELSLYTNCRNTRNIHDEFQPYTSAKSICHAEPGPEVETIRVKNGKDMVRAAKTLLLKLVGEDEVSPSDITILTPRANGVSDWIDGLELGTLTLSWDLNVARESRGVIGVSTIYSYKGLENTVILLTEMERANEQLTIELSYIGISRARAAIFQLSQNILT